MAYITGFASDMEALRAAFFSACTDNGWSNTGDVIHKDDIYILVQIDSGYLTLRGVQTVGGGGALGSVVRIGRPSTAVPELVWPLTYHVFIGVTPDEVYLVVNYDVDKFQFAAFGRSVVSDLPGSKVWYAASLGSYTHNLPGYVTISADGGGAAGLLTMGIFWLNIAFSTNQNSVVNHGVDGEIWSTYNNMLSASRGCSALMAALPSAWNSESVLVPIQVWMQRSTSKVSLVADLNHARYVRVDNHNPGDVITLGSDRWKIFPFHKKDTVVRNGAAAINHTGTFGWAIRYDGP